ncbi:hydrolase 1, exosortase A system-associated [Altererythrobacter lauratis]|uniref:Hydrolase 1, exosortase A system-associated n=1 Tax=Alteraurantiacibacter lauratis TaxID=2054627 RepID=A0ABV7ECN4_9SPHN
MSRRHFTFACAGETLAATLDDAEGRVGLLIVTGGNEVRSGAFSGQARLAARIAAAGYPVLRFDRRGVGDSTGSNSGFTGSAPDIAAAIAAFRAQAPHIERLVAFGNCDAASALLLAGGAGCDALVLANPWTFDSADEAPAPQAVRARYAAKLKSPREVLRLLSGDVSLAKLLNGLRRALSPSRPPSGLLGDIQAGHARFAGKTAILLAPRDRTAQAFMAAWPASKRLWQLCEGADHGFSDEASSAWLFNALFTVLEEEAGQLDMG